MESENGFFQSVLLREVCLTEPNVKLLYAVNLRFAIWVTHIGGIVNGKVWRRRQEPDVKQSILELNAGQGDISYPDSCGVHHTA